MLKFAFGFCVSMIMFVILSAANTSDKTNEIVSQCNSVDGQRQIIKNNILYRVQIATAYKSCMVDSSNMINVDNMQSGDIKEIQNNCLHNAHKMYGGSKIDINTDHFAAIEASLRLCGEV